MMRAKKNQKQAANLHNIMNNDLHSMFDLILMDMQVRSDPCPKKAPRVNQNEPKMVKQFVYSSLGSGGSSHWLGENLAST